MKKIVSQLFGARKFGRHGTPGSKISRAPEVLENRDVPAVIVGLADGGATLVIRGDATGAAHDKVEVLENHDLSRNGIEVRYNYRADGSYTSRRFDSDEVQKIFADLGAGADEFNYRLLSDYDNPKRFEVKLGSGNDSANFYMNREIEDTLNIKVWGGDGHDTVWSNFGRIDEDVTMAFWADLGRGDDRLPMFFAGDIDEGANVFVRVHGGVGNDTLTVAALNDVDIDRNARLQVALFGQNDVDQLGFYYRGENDGVIDLTLDGGSGFDTRNDGYHPDRGSDGQYTPRVVSMERTFRR
jgi:hypothetical protein